MGAWLILIGMVLAIPSRMGVEQWTMLLAFVLIVYIILRLIDRAVKWLLGDRNRS